MARPLIVLYRLSTSNHNREESRRWRLRIVLYRLSTSNHNRRYATQPLPAIVLYRLSTSNHNILIHFAEVGILSYIVFLHQTTTVFDSHKSRTRLSYIVFLHQTTTTY